MPTSGFPGLRRWVAPSVDRYVRPGYLNCHGERAASLLASGQRLQPRADFPAGWSPGLTPELSWLPKKPEPWRNVVGGTPSGLRTSLSSILAPEMTQPDLRFQLG